MVQEIMGEGWGCRVVQVLGGSRVRVGRVMSGSGRGWRGAPQRQEGATTLGRGVAAGYQISTVRGTLGCVVSHGLGISGCYCLEIKDSKGWQGERHEESPALGVAGYMSPFLSKIHGVEIGSL